MLSSAPVAPLDADDAATIDAEAELMRQVLGIAGFDSTKVRFTFHT